MSDVADDLQATPQLELSAPSKLERETEFEERIHKLESALAERNNSAFNEDAVAERVIAKLSSVASLRQSPDGSDRVLVLASSPDDRPPPPKGTVLHPPEVVSDPTQRTWFLSQLLAEFRLALHMYFDPRYRISSTPSSDSRRHCPADSFAQLSFSPSGFNIPFLGSPNCGACPMR